MRVAVAGVLVAIKNVAQHLGRITKSGPRLTYAPINQILVRVALVPNIACTIELKGPGFGYQILCTEVDTIQTEM